VRAEMQQIRNYLSLQKARFGESLETVVQVEEQLLEGPMIRLLLQPLVENAFKHAFQNKAELKILLIKARGQDGRLILDITDNGCGMTADQVQALERWKDDEMTRPKGRSGLGIRSV